MPRALGNLRVWILILALGWLAMVVVQISRTPDPGAGSPDELALRVTDALRAHDSPRLEPLLVAGGEDVAKSTVDGFAATHVASGRFTGGAVVVEFVDDDGTSGSVRIPVQEKDGRWMVSPIVAP